jgi:hypothetical protein
MTLLTLQPAQECVNVRHAKKGAEAAPRRKPMLAHRHIDTITRQRNGCRGAVPRNRDAFCERLSGVTRRPGVLVGSASVNNVCRPETVQPGSGATCNDRAESADTRKSMPAKAKSATKTQKRKTTGATPASQPVRLFVRRGAEKRFQKLKEKTANLNVEVSWDRREGERRATSNPVSGERRKQDRRQQPRFTWDVADFEVAVNSASKE